MAFLTAATVFSTLLLFHQLIARTSVQAYAIDHSCKPYSKDQVDKTALIQAAMTEAKQMMTKAATQVINDHRAPSWDNSLISLWPGATVQDVHSIAAKYTYAAKNVPWTVTDYNSLEFDSLSIYCGGDNFTPDPGDGADNNAWIEMTSFITVYGLPHNEDDSANFCSVHGTASTLHSSLLKKDYTAGYQLVVLCDGALIRGISPDSTGSQSGIGSIQASPQKAGLYPGKPIDNIAYTVALSFTLLHELMHVTQSSSFFHGTAEAYGWSACTLLPISYGMMNIDNYAYYALAAYLPPDYFVFNGLLGSYRAWIAYGNAFVYQP
ncbi:hypothetical protein BDR22DRAFT_968788 [Usnea florida]